MSKVVLAIVFEEASPVVVAVSVNPVPIAEWFNAE